MWALEYASCSKGFPHILLYYYRAFDMCSLGKLYLLIELISEWSVESGGGLVIYVTGFDTDTSPFLHRFVIFNCPI